VLNFLILRYFLVFKYEVVVINYPCHYLHPCAFFLLQQFFFLVVCVTLSARGGGVVVVVTTPFIGIDLHHDATKSQASSHCNQEVSFITM